MTKHCTTSLVKNNDLVDIKHRPEPTHAAAHINWPLGANSFGFLALITHMRCVETQFQRASRAAKHKVSRDSCRKPDP
jgi:hypothetical protein